MIPTAVKSPILVLKEIQTIVSILSASETGATVTQEENALCQVVSCADRKQTGRGHCQEKWPHAGKLSPEGQDPIGVLNKGLTANVCSNSVL